MVRELEDFGFALPVEGDTDVAMRALDEESKRVDHYIYEADEEEEFKNFHQIDRITEIEGDVISYKSSKGCC